MSTLYLFGNGFDIAHDIKTPYSSFRNYLSEHHETFLTRFEAMYHIQPLDDTKPGYKKRLKKGGTIEFAKIFGKNAKKIWVTRMLMECMIQAVFDRRNAIRRSYRYAE